MWTALVTMHVKRQPHRLKSETPLRHPSAAAASCRGPGDRPRDVQGDGRRAEAAKGPGLDVLLLRADVSQQPRIASYYNRGCGGVAPIEHRGLARLRQAQTPQMRLRVQEWRPPLPIRRRCQPRPPHGQFLAQRNRVCRATKQC